MTYAVYTDFARPTRSGNKFTASCRKITGGSWTEWTWTDWRWYVSANGQDGVGDFNHYGQTGAPTSDNLVLDRTAFYPVTSRKINIVYSMMRGTGDVWGPWITSPTLAMQPPYQPGLSLNVGTGSSSEVAATASFPGETTEREVHDVVFEVVRRANFGTQSAKLHSAVCSSPSDPNLTYTGNVSNIESGLTSDRWIEVTATARARGLAGDSSTVTKTHVFAWPGSPQVTGVSVSGTVTSSGMAIISCRSNQSKYHPTDTVQLLLFPFVSVNLTTQTAASPPPLSTFPVSVQLSDVSDTSVHVPATAGMSDESASLSDSMFAASTYASLESLYARL